MALKRQSNIELCRIAAILLVLIVHTTRRSLGNDVSFGILLLSGFSIIGVNVFVLITGYFSARPKKLSLANLLFICFFWMVLRLIINLLSGQPIDVSFLFFLSKSTWFIPCYLGLLFFAPFLNEYCLVASKRQLVGGVLFIFLILTWFDWVKPVSDIALGSLSGYSLLSFMAMYLLGRTIRLHGLPNWFRKGSPFIYITCALVMALMALLMQRIGHQARVGWCFAYNNPIVIVSSVAFFSCFTGLKLKDSEAINHISKSTLSVLLGHFSIMPLYCAQFRYLYDNYTGALQVFYWSFSVIVTFIACVIVDQFRLFFYKKTIEPIFKSKVKNNELNK